MCLMKCGVKVIYEAVALEGNQNHTYTLDVQVLTGYPGRYELPGQLWAIYRTLDLSMYLRYAVHFSVSVR